jgi:hypothetical protein
MPAIVANSGSSPADGFELRVTDRFGEEHLLAQEAVQQRHAGHRAGGDDRQRGGDRHHAEHAIDPAHVARAAFVVDDAGGHEQRGLEDGVVDDVKDAGDHRQRRVETEQQGDQAQVADRRVGQQALDVVRKSADRRGVDEGHRAGAADQPEPQVAAAERRVQAGEQEDAGLDHRRRMQVGRYRRRRRHRVRQPEVEGKLRRLGERAEQDQDQRRRVERVRANRSPAARITDSS